MNVSDSSSLPLRSLEMNLRVQKLLDDQVLVSLYLPVISIFAGLASVATVVAPILFIVPPDA